MRLKNNTWIKKLSSRVKYLSTINVIQLIEVEENKVWHSTYRDYIQREEVE